MPKKTPLDYIQKAIDEVGQKALADAWDVSIGFISNIYNGRTKLPATADRAIDLEERCGAIVTRYQMRPDAYGKAPKAN